MHFYLAAGLAARRQIGLPCKTKSGLIGFGRYYMPLAKIFLGSSTTVPADRNPYQYLEHDAYESRGINRTDREASKVTLRRGTS